MQTHFLSRIGVTCAVVLIGYIQTTRGAVIVQSPGANAIAFEAEGNAELVNGVNVVWENRSGDSEASGGGFLYAFEAGQQDNGAAPQSFARYQLKFSEEGTYTLYYRWRADTLYTAGDPFTANSLFLPTAFGAPATPGDQGNYASSVSNNINQPESESFNWVQEPAEFAVSAGDAGAGTILVLNIGNRERGFQLDRIVLSTNPALTELDLQLLINSGAGAALLTAESASGSSTQTRATLAFSRPVVQSSIQTGDFSIADTSDNNAPLAVNSATLSAVDPRVIFLQTASQTPGHVYSVTINGLTADTGSEIATDTQVHFTAWQIVSGWWKRDVFLDIPGFEIANLTSAPNYPELPDRTEFSAVLQPIPGDNYGLRYDGFFIPDQNGVYTFFFTADDQAEFYLSSNSDPANLTQLGGLFDSIANGGALDIFQDALSVASPPLVAGEMYAMRILHKEEGSAEFLRMAARHQSSSVAPEDLPELGGDLVAAYLNPDLGVVSFSTEPQDATATAGSRAEFFADVDTGNDAAFQWQLNGVDIPNATRKNYITPVLTANDNGNEYRVVATVIGIQNISRSASLDVRQGPPSNLEPYIGVNMIGGAADGGGAAVPNVPGNVGVLSPTDVTGVVLQGRWNNIEGSTVTEVPVADANGDATPVTVSTAGAQQWHTGTELLTRTSHGALLQGYAATSMAADAAPMAFTFHNVPQDNYHLYVYSIGFSFQASYEEQVTVIGAEPYPVYHVRGQSGSDFITQPGFIPMSSQDAGNPDLGNYVRIENVRPDASGNLSIEILNESVNIGQDHGPPLNGVQLVRVLDIVALDDRITVTIGADGNLALAWDDANFDLVASPNVEGPYAPAGLTSGASVDPSQGAMFYTLERK